VTSKFGPRCGSKNFLKKLYHCGIRAIQRILQFLLTIFFRGCPTSNKPFEFGADHVTTQMHKCFLGIFATAEYLLL